MLSATSPGGPQLVARVRYLAGGNYLRHGTVRGFTRGVYS